MTNQMTKSAISHRLPLNKDNLDASPSFVDDLTIKSKENSALFSLLNSNYSYHNQALFINLSLTIKSNEKVAIIGASGVGKTSLLKLLNQQQPQKTAFCQQQLLLINNLNSYNNIYIGRLDEFSNWQNLCNLIYANKKQWQKIYQLCEQLEIEPLINKSVSQLSGGQQQRVAIARALYQSKAVFFGDEPVSSLDPRLAHKTLKLLTKQHDCCVVSLHDRELALQYFDRIIGLKSIISPTTGLPISQIAIDQHSASLQLGDLDELYR